MKMTAKFSTCHILLIFFLTIFIVSLGLNPYTEQNKLKRLSTKVSVAFRTTEYIPNIKSNHNTLKIMDVDSVIKSILLYDENIFNYLPDALKKIYSLSTHYLGLKIKKKKLNSGRKMEW